MGYSDRQFTRLSMGRLLGDLSARLQERISNPSDRLRLALYGCHDTTLGGILNALDCFDDKWPVFTAYVSFELFKKASSTPTAGGISSWLSSWKSPATQDYYIRFRYNCKDIKLPACSAPGNHLEGSDGTVCTCRSTTLRLYHYAANLIDRIPLSVDAFREAVQKISITTEEWEKECKQSPPPSVA